MDQSRGVAELADLAGAFRDHWERLVAMIRRRIPPALDGQMGAEAIVSEAFLKAQGRWKERPDDSASLFCWLFGFARDIVNEGCRLKRIQMEVTWPGQASDTIAHGLVADDTTPSAALRRSEAAEVVRKVIYELDHDDRELILMLDFEGLSGRDAASVLGIATDAVYKRHERILLGLRKRVPASLDPRWTGP